MRPPRARRRPAPLAAAVAAALAAAPQTARAQAEAASACEALLQLENIQQVVGCADEATAGATQAQSKSVRKALEALQETREACVATPEKGTGLGCKVLSDLAYELFARGLFLLRSCQLQPSECEERGRLIEVLAVDSYRGAVDRYQNTPVDGMVTRWLRETEGDVFGALTEERQLQDESLPAAWNVTLRAVQKVKFWVTGYVWRETQWHWLTDSMAAGKVVQTAWGEADEWLRFGVHDAYADAPLPMPPPKYMFSDELGMRWEILIRQLRTLHERRGGAGPLLVVEIGVFAGHLSHLLLSSCDFIQLLGVDPYIGADDTFPGNYSQSLEPELAHYKASTLYEPFGDRARLWPLTSEAAAAELPDGSVDAIFIDGCHFYDCVKQDFQLWMPKMRRDADVLVAGHDFSPQWPGVVQAVHEQRVGGKEVNLASDWMFWWFDRFQ